MPRPQRCAYEPCSRWINFGTCWATDGKLWCSQTCMRASEREQEAN